MEESSDEDIEIIATKENPNKILEVLQRYEETKRDLEEIEKNSILETRQHTPQVFQKEKEDSSNKRKNVTDIICIDSEDGSDCEREEDVQVKAIVSRGQNKRLKTGDSNDSSKLSTSEMFLAKQFTDADEVLSDPDLSIDDLDDDDEETKIVESSDSIDVTRCLHSFIETCQKILPQAEFDSVEKKLLKNLNKLDPKYTHDDSLKNFVDLKLSLVNTDQDSVYVHVKEVLEELKKFRSETFSSGETSEFSDQEVIKTQTKKRISLTTLSSVVTKTPEDSADVKERDISDKPDDFEVEGVQKTVSSKHIRKLEAALAACAKQIQKCDEAEIDWENEEDSNFLMADRWKKKYMSIYNKLAEYKGTSKSLERTTDKRFNFNESKFPAVNRKIEKFVNRTKCFPDFWDIKGQIENINKEDSLHLTDMQIHNEAEKIFISVGKKLKKRRNLDDGSVMYSYLKPEDSDPASNDTELDSKLSLLGKEAKVRIEKVFEEFTEKQAAAGKSNEEESDTENEEEEEEEEEDPGLDSFSLNAQSHPEDSHFPLEEEDCHDNDVPASPLRASSECSAKSSESIKDLLEDSD